MAGAPRNGSGSVEPAAGPDDLDRRRAAFDRGLEDAKSRHEPPRGSLPHGALGMAFRIAVEFVAGLFVGGFIGWQLDAWLGTAPWLFLVLLGFGMAAGMVNVFRHAYRMNRDAQAPDETNERSGDDRQG